jgi:hypothetical protein
MKKQLPHLANRGEYLYTAWSKNYKWSGTFIANSVKDARALGRREITKVFGNHAPVHGDSVELLTR